MTARFRNTNAFAAGVSLFGCGVPLLGVSIAFGVLALNSKGGAFNDDIAIAFGSIGGAATASGIALLSYGWPIALRAEPLAAHSDVNAAPPAIISSLPVTP